MIPYNHQYIKLSDNPEMKRIVRAAFPSYKKHEVALSFAETVTISGTYWDGGSRSTYIAVEINTLRTLGAPHYNPLQFGGPKENPKVEIPAGVAILEGGTFCGKPATVHVFLRPDDAPKSLLAPK